MKGHAMRHHELQRSDVTRTQASGQFRLYDPLSCQWLHLGAKMPTKSLNYAWIGTRAQAQTLATRAEAESTPWPYIEIHREIADQTVPQLNDHLEVKRAYPLEAPK